MDSYLKTLRNYILFDGRMSRKEFWSFFVIHIAITFFLNILSSVLSSQMIVAVYQVSVFLPFLGAWIRRMHDVGKSGWYCLIPIYCLILAATEGDRGNNQYGMNPEDENATPFDNNSTPFSKN